MVLFCHFLMKEDVVEYQSVHKQGEKKYVRPSVPGEKHLLLRKYVNRYTSMSRENVRYVIRNAFEKEHITGYWKGTHALRRTAASKIFNNGTGLKLTADILGHESLDSTKAI